MTNKIPPPFNMSKETIRLESTIYNVFFKDSFNIEYDVLSI